MACACFTRNCQSSRSVRDAPGLFCQGCARSVPANHNTPPPGFFVSVASKGLRVYVSGLESTLAGISTSVDSKEVARGEKDNSRTANFDAVRLAQSQIKSIA